MFSYKPIRYGAVVQPGLGRQIVNLEVAGSNPVGPAIFHGTVSWDVNPRPGVPKGVCPLRGVRDARNNERYDPPGGCPGGRRRDGEAAGSSYEGAGPLSRSRRGKLQRRVGDGAWFKSRRPRHFPRSVAVLSMQGWSIDALG